MTPPALTQRLQRFSPHEAKILDEWLEKNPIGINLALRLLELLEDLSKKESRPMTDFFAEIPGGDRLEPKERGRQWVQRLEDRLHPHLKAHAESFAAQLRGLGLPKGANIEPPQGFEGRNYTLTISFADKDELRRRIDVIRSSLEEKDWDWLWNF